MVKEISKESDVVFLKGLTKLIGQPLIEAITTRDDYVIFSIFTINEGDNAYKAIGLLNKVFLKL
jgi:hypothetical protein